MAVAGSTMENTMLNFAPEYFYCFVEILAKTLLTLIYRNTSKELLATPMTTHRPYKKKFQRQGQLRQGNV